MKFDMIFLHINFDNIFFFVPFTAPKFTGV